MGYWNVFGHGDLRFAAQLGIVPSDRVFRSGADRAVTLLWKSESGVQSIKRRNRSLDLFDLYSVHHGDVDCWVGG